MTSKTLDLSKLRADAEALAEALPSLAVRTRAASTAHIGSAGRRKSGSGEHFWQYRRYGIEDDSKRIDWRRSARGQRLYVRETELETARTFLIWCDPSAGFHWRSDPSLPLKAEIGASILLSLGMLMSKNGEKAGVLGGRAPSFGKKMGDRLSEDLIHLNEAPHFPNAPQNPATLLIASDFYDPVSVWEERLNSLSGTVREGVLLSIADPAEIDFPYSGRTRLKYPGSGNEQLLSRAERVQEAYKAKYIEQRNAISELAHRMGWRMVHHVTTEPTIEAAAKVSAALASLGAEA